VTTAGRLLRREEGQAVVEYGVLGALISVVAVVLITGVGVKVAAFFESVASALS
jgi:Flp pilus assembly pilin Flp